MKTVRGRQKDVGSNIDLEYEIFTTAEALKGYANHLTEDSEKAQELVSETVFKAVSNVSKFKPGTNLKAWLITIMKNTFINNYRLTKRRKMSPEVKYLFDPAKKRVTNDGEKELLLEDITEAFEKISDDQREIFLMFFEGFKYLEIAEKLDLPLGTVKSRIFMARKNLMENIKFRMEYGMNN